MIRLIKYLRRWLLSDIYHNETSTQCLINTEINEILSDIARIDEKALILSGRKVYSQCDEDGIIEEIFRRIGTTNNLFIFSPYQNQQVLIFAFFAPAKPTMSYSLNASSNSALRSTSL